MLIRLGSMISAVCPIVGVSSAVSGTQAGPGNVRIDYADSATAEQRQAAQAVAVAFDWSQAVHDTWTEDRKPARKAIRVAAAQSIADNESFLAIATPTQAQVLAHVRAITRQMNKLITFVATLEG